MTESIEAETSERIILLACARQPMDALWGQRLRRALSGRVVWDALLWQGERHGLTPLLHHHLSQAAAGRLPDGVAERLAQSGREIAQTSLFLTGEFLRLLEVFAAEGIPVIPYKGPVLAVTAYGNLGLRRMSDVDLLVRRQDIGRGVELLERLGFRREGDLTPAQARFAVRYAYTFDFLHDKGLRVEMHWAPVPRNMSIAWNAEGVWERARSAVLLGRQMMVASPEDTLLMLCLHGLKSAWCTVGMLTDVHQWVGAHPDLDWTTLLEMAEGQRCERALLLGLQSSRELLGTELPGAVLSRLEADPEVSKLAGRVKKRLWREVATQAESVAGLTGLTLRCQRGLWNQAVCLLRLAATPSLYDVVAVRLPRPLFALYYGLRPLRVLWKYGAGVLPEALRRQ